MKSILKIVGVVFVVATLFTACNGTPSLQKYIVESKENDEFISVDIPSSILQLKDSEVSEDIKSTLETIKKVNFLALQLSDSNQGFYESEVLKVKAILKNPKYQQLMRVKMSGTNVTVNFLGEDDAIDEVIIFAADSEKGFGIIRVLGENMNPSDIMKLSQEIKLDGDSNELKQIENIFKDI
ncbi:DUF4252 domain-containing protein [Lutibacter holmesii]|uniref:DUF4252 domain-containing protein n=1 Tax=Lutibacter holmesii TaxID=1137985 RepID=A0ABW3WNX0_9FLAO